MTSSAVQSYEIQSMLIYLLEFIKRNNCRYKAYKLTMLKLLGRRCSQLKRGTWNTIFKTQQQQHNLQHNLLNNIQTECTWNLTTSPVLPPPLADVYAFRILVFVCLFKKYIQNHSLLTNLKGKLAATVYGPQNGQRRMLFCTPNQQNSWRTISYNLAEQFSRTTAVRTTVDVMLNN